MKPTGVYYYDIKTAKPNREGFEELKKKLILWSALHISNRPEMPAFARLGIPYNPYHPEPYTRWTLNGLFDLEGEEVLVGESFWNTVADDNVYQDLLDVFEWAGRQLRVLIDRRFPNT